MAELSLFAHEGTQESHRSKSLSASAAGEPVVVLGPPLVLPCGFFSSRDEILAAYFCRSWSMAASRGFVGRQSQSDFKVTLLSPLAQRSALHRWTLQDFELHWTGNAIVLRSPFPKL
jgi:hypothetical protein